jgi:hypothetical protein
MGDNIIYTPDQLNTFFATPQAIIPSNTDFNSAFDSPTDEFAVINICELEIYNTIHQIRSNAVGADGVPIKFLKIILHHILPYITHVFNTILMLSSYPALIEINKDYASGQDQQSRQSLGLQAYKYPAKFVQTNGSNHGEPDHCTHRKKWNDESTSTRIQIKPQPF